MQIIELLGLIDEETAVNVWEDGEIVAYYDGKNSIPESFGSKTIRKVYAGHFSINIEL